MAQKTSRGSACWQLPFIREKHDGINCLRIAIVPQQWLGILEI
jgi:hypothetical protein